MSPTEATIYYGLFWFLFILQFINWGLWHCILPGLCLAAGLIWWFVLELQNYTSDSIVTGTLVVIFVQFFFIFPRRLLFLILDIKLGSKELNEDQDHLFFVRLCYYALLWLFYALLGDSVLFVSINIANVTVQLGYVILRLYLPHRTLATESAVQPGMKRQARGVSDAPSGHRLF